MATAPRNSTNPVETFTLPAGTLEITIETQSAPLGQLCDFAARNNSKRGFLIVSKILGRHMPATPSVMQKSYDDLAAQIPTHPADMPGPIVFVGMAETAICLGQGVHAAYRRLSGRTDTLYIHTTRQQLDAEVMARFDEPHSHATSHLLYYPQTVVHRELLATARSLVLVDDEVSTGTTFKNLAAALTPHMPAIQQIATVVLTDWSDHEYLKAMRAPTSPVSLLKGRLRWSANPDYVPEVDPNACSYDQAPEALGRLVNTPNFGRLGIQEDPAIIDAIAEKLYLEIKDGPRIVLLGTGEFTYLPFLLAKALEDRGIDVEVQSTTRSPVHIGGAIQCALTFKDNYGTPVPNFLYNVHPEDTCDVIICHETPEGSVDNELVRHLAATCVYLGRSA